jgi:hypothetical protein
MSRNAFVDFLVNLIAGALALTLLAGIAWFLWNAGVLDPLVALIK